MNYKRKLHSYSYTVYSFYLLHMTQARENVQTRVDTFYEYIMRVTRSIYLRCFVNRRDRTIVTSFYLSFIVASTDRVSTITIARARWHTNI